MFVYTVVLLFHPSSFLQSVELDRLALYWDSDSIPWHLDKLWEDLLPSEWFQVCPVSR